MSSTVSKIYDTKHRWQQLTTEEKIEELREKINQIIEEMP